MCALKREELFPGITFNSVSDERFKTNKISVHLVTPLDTETASENALIPSLLRKGYEGLSDFTEFNQFLSELYGANVMFGVQKSGDNQVLSLSISSIDDKYTLDDEHLTEKLTETLFRMLLHPPMKDGLFDKKEIALEKAALADAIEAEINNKRMYALSRSTSLMCEGEPYGTHECGTVEQAKALTAEQVTKAYHNLLNTAGIEIMFVGCGDAEICRTIAQKECKCLARSSSDVLSAKSEVHLKREKMLLKTDKMDVTQSKMVLGFASEVLPGTADYHALRMMVGVLGGTPMSKLFLNVREKLSLCYYCAATLDKSKGIVRIDSGVENENIEKANNEILFQLGEIQQGNVTDEEIKDALMSLVNTYQTVGDSVNTVEGYYLGQILDGTTYTPEEEVEKLRQVTKDDIIRVSNKLHLDITYVLTSKDESGKEAESC